MITIQTLAKFKFNSKVNFSKFSETIPTLSSQIKSLDVNSISPARSRKNRRQNPSRRIISFHTLVRGCSDGGKNFPSNLATFIESDARILGYRLDCRGIPRGCSFVYIRGGGGDKMKVPPFFAATQYATLTNFYHANPGYLKFK